MIYPLVKRCWKPLASSFQSVTATVTRAHRSKPARGTGALAPTGLDLDTLRRNRRRPSALYPLTDKTRSGSEAELQPVNYTTSDGNDDGTGSNVDLEAGQGSAEPVGGILKETWVKVEKERMSQVSLFDTEAFSGRGDFTTSVCAGDAGIAPSTGTGRSRRA